MFLQKHLPKNCAALDCNIEDIVEFSKRRIEGQQCIEN